jgi:hypothetical protein
MYNLARAAEAGWQGNVADARDYHLKWDGHEAGSLSGHQHEGTGE